MTIHYKLINLLFKIEMFVTVSGINFGYCNCIQIDEEIEMTKMKTGLLYSELTGNVYWGTMNAETGIARGNKKDVTSDFIGILLKKFPPNFKQNIVCDGKFEAEIIVLGEENKNRARFEAAKEMEDMLAQLQVEGGLGTARHRQIDRILAKARGENA